jgi:hypothetical protein
LQELERERERESERARARVNLMDQRRFERERDKEWDSLFIADEIGCFFRVYFERVPNWES